MDRSGTRSGRREESWPQDLADDFRWVSSRLGPEPVARRQVVVRRHRSSGFPGGGLLLLFLALFVIVPMFARGPGITFFILPILFLALPIFFIARMVRSFGRASRGASSAVWLEETQTPDVIEPVDPREERLQRTCDQIRAVLERSPESVRAFLSQPEETVEALRRTGMDLLNRERSLRAITSSEEDRRLEDDRRQLLTRIDRENDVVARNRLSAALTALDHQRQQREAILRSANRLDAELTRLVYTLEGLHTQLLRVESAGGPQEAGEGLRWSIESLRNEMEALAEALEEVGAVTPPAVLRARPEARETALRPSDR